MIELDSLLGDEVGIGDVLGLENCGPEACQLMAVVNLNDMELLEDARVKSQLVVLEAGKNLATEVDSQQVVKLLLGFEVTLVSLEIVLDLVDITGALEESVHGLLTSLDALNRRLAGGDLLGDGVDAGTDGLELGESGSESRKIIDLSLKPMIKVSEGVSQVVDGVLQALSQVASILVVHHELA